MTEIIMWIIAVISGIGCGFFFWELILNLKTVPHENRPALFQSEFMQHYQSYGALVALIFVPMFGVWKWGWIGLFSYQVFPAACALLGFAFYLGSSIFKAGNKS